MIWELPKGDVDFSNRMRLVKSFFSHHVNESYKNLKTESRMKKGELAVWQRRFWEHMIRDEDDLLHHVEYIHYNPVKHGLGTSPKDWLFSSFHDFVNQDLYDEDWGTISDMRYLDKFGNE